MIFTFLFEWKKLIANQENSSSSDRLITCALDFFAWTNGSAEGLPAEAAPAVWNGSGWAITETVFSPGVDIRAVPLPPCVLLLGSGFLGLGLLGWRRKTSSSPDHLHNPKAGPQWALPFFVPLPFPVNFSKLRARFTQQNLPHPATG